MNAGDALNLFAVDTVLVQLPTLGLARTLGLIHEILHMCRETVEGQAIELGWIRREPRAGPTTSDYFTMSTKKTGWYTCIGPVPDGRGMRWRDRPGAVLDRFNEAFRWIGIAFQIQDDVLNLIGETELYGKEPLGDMLEGKRTVMMIHLFREADSRTRRRMEAITGCPVARRPSNTREDMFAAMQRVGSIEYAIELADRLAHRGVAQFEENLVFLPENEAKSVLRQIANYVTTRPSNPWASPTSPLTQMRSCRKIARLWQRSGAVTIGSVLCSARLHGVAWRSASRFRSGPRHCWQRCRGSPSTRAVSSSSTSWSGKIS